MARIEGGCEMNWLWCWRRLTQQCDQQQNNNEVVSAALFVEVQQQAERDYLQKLSIQSTTQW